MERTEEISITFAALRSVGNVVESARIAGRSLLAAERLFIERARMNAIRLDLSEALITSLEEEGAEIVRRGRG